MNNIEDELGSDIFAGIEVEEAPAARSAITDFEEVRTLWDSAVEQKYLRMMSDPTFDMTKANTRFSTSLPLNRVYNATAAIVGAGGLGNWQWRTLLCMGFRHVAIFDDDTVGIENVGPQAHSMLDIGMPKVEAVRRAALEYRGVAITAVNERVYTYADICEKLGYQPDIVITCTDSAEFRNGFIRDMQGCMSYLSRIDDVPELLLDYRMSLGDWVCYAIPARAWKIFAAREHTSRRLMNKYLNEAVFSAEEALHEPCTERAIAYTGMHAASYTGAYLHWWLLVKEGIFCLRRAGV